MLMKSTGWPVPVLLGLVLFFGLPNGSVSRADAASVPESSYSSGLGVSPLLLDYPTLAFAIPSRLSSFEPGLGTFSNSLLVSAKVGGSTWGVLSHPGGTTGILWSGGGESLRIGVGVQVAHQVLDATRTDGNGSERDVELKNAAIEPMLSVTRLKGDVSFDLAVSFRRDEESGAIRFAESDDFRTYRKELDAKFRPGFLVRVGLPLSERSHLRMAATWADRSVEYNGLEFERDFENEGYGHTLSVESAIRTSLSSRSDLVGSVSFTQVKATIPATLSRRVSLGRTNVADAGLAVETELISNRLTGLFGVRWRYLDSRVRNRYITHSEIGDSRLLDDFNWGLAYRWRQLSLVGKIEQHVSLSDLFYAIDVEFAL